MSVIIRLQNLPWSANALDIRNFFRGLSIPEGGVHIVGGELGDAFIAFSTDEDARQAMMLNDGKIKEIQVKLLLSSRSEMHKVIEAARQSVPILTLTAPAVAPAPVITPAPATIQPPTTTLATVNPFVASITNSNSFYGGIPGIGNPQEIPQPAVIEPPAPMVSPTSQEREDADRLESESKRSNDRDSRDRRRSLSRSRSRSRGRDRKSKRDRRDRSRSRERRRRDRSRSRERRKRGNRSRSRDRSPRRRRNDVNVSRDRKSPPNVKDNQADAAPAILPNPYGTPMNVNMPTLLPHMMGNQQMLNGPLQQNNDSQQPNRFSDPGISETLNKLEELGKKRNPNAFQGDQNGGGKFAGGRGGAARGSFRREGRPSRFDDTQRNCCVAIRNAPNHTSYGDVRRFFPFLIDKHGIKMINDNMGRRTGNIFVRFCDAQSKHIALKNKNNELKGTQVTVEHLDDDVYDQAIDSFLPYREENDDEDPSLIIADSEEPPQASFNILKLTDLPYYVKELEIIKMFNEFSLLSILLTECRTTRSKIAFVQFAKSEDAKLAFDGKDKYFFGRRRPTFTIVTAEEYEREKTKIEKMQESSISEDVEVIAPPIEKPEPTKPRDPRQRRTQLENNVPTHVPTVGPRPPLQSIPGAAPFFPGPFMQQPNFPVASQFPGNFPAPGAIDPRTAAANWAARPGFGNPMNQMQTPPTNNNPPIDLDNEPLDCVLMKGLPHEATDRTIVNFLADTGAVPARIHLMLDTNGMPSGDCFCEFRSTQEARLATKKHGKNLDGYRITIDIVARSVVEDALEGPKTHEPQVPPDNNINIPQPQQPPQFFEQQRGGMGGFGPRQPFRGRGGFDRGGFNNSNFNNRGGFDQSRGGFRGRGIDRGGRGRGNFDRGRGRGFGRGRGGGGFENGRDRGEEEKDPTLEEFGAPGCVVSMENVPFRATVDDLLSFFSEFDLTQDDIIRRYNERGQPTGDARVAFRTPFDAQRAAKTRNMDMIFDRRISLALI